MAILSSLPSLGIQVQGGGGWLKHTCFESELFVHSHSPSQNSNQKREEKLFKMEGKMYLFAELGYFKIRWGEGVLKSPLIVIPIPCLQGRRAAGRTGFPLHLREAASHLRRAVRGGVQGRWLYIWLLVSCHGRAAAVIGQGSCKKFFVFMPTKASVIFLVLKKPKTDFGKKNFPMFGLPIIFAKYCNKPVRSLRHSNPTTKFNRIVNVKYVLFQIGNKTK